MNLLTKLKQGLGLIPKEVVKDPEIISKLCDRFQGCMMLGAAGDAFGYVIEFKQIDEILRTYRGPLQFKNIDHWRTNGEFVVSDDTQMTLFTAEACDLAVRARPPEPPVTYSLPNVVNSNARLTYLDWYQTQRGGQPPANRSGRLISFNEMHKAQAPGGTCLAALKDGGRGGIQKNARVNDSMGCGGVMRVAPLAFLPEITDREVFALACRTAAVTHGHDMGIYPAGAFALTLKHVINGYTVADAARETLSFLAGMEAAAQLRDHMLAALSFEGRGPVTPKELETLGGGWVGHECFAIGLAASILKIALPDRMTIAANHSGDSDSTASVAGQLMGTAVGLRGVRNRFPEFATIEAHLDVKRPMEFVIKRFQESVIA